MYLVCTIGGVVLGIIIAAFIFRKRPIGNLNIDRSDPTEQPYIFLELYKNVGDFSGKKYVTLRVSNKNYLSQK
jgi:hypothetical protein